MSVKKNLFALLAIVLCVGVFAAEKIKLAPGAGCFAWNQNTKSKPESLPVGGFVDESTKFYSGNIRQCEELKNIRGRHFIMWEGYLQVPKTGKYRFSYTTDGMYGRYANVTIFLNEKLLLKRFEGEDETVSAVGAYMLTYFLITAAAIRLSFT